MVGWFVHPVFGFLNTPLRQISEGISLIPQAVVQVALAVAALALAVRWVIKFLDARRSPAGLAKLTDDDYFRIIFALAGALIMAFVVLILWPGLSSWLLNAFSDLFTVLSEKFGNGRSGRPLDVALPDVIQVGKFPNYGPSGLNLSIGFAAVFFGVVVNVLVVKK